MQWGGRIDESGSGKPSQVQQNEQVGEGGNEK